jgi:hypothetical protein
MRRSRLRRLVVPFLMALVLSGGPAKVQDVHFVSVIEDLPLMAGLAEDTDAAMTFDSAQGRIVEAHATGNVSTRAVAAFYAATLPALGWQAAAEGQYERGGEVLTLEIEPAGANAASVRFALRPGAR